MASPMMRRPKRFSKSCNMSSSHGGSSEGEGEDGGEKMQQKKHQSFARGLSLSNFSKSFVTLQTSLTRIAHLSPLSHSHSHSAPSSPVCDSPRSVNETSACSTPTSLSSTSSSSSTPSTPSRRSHHYTKRPTCVVFGKRNGHTKRSKSAGQDERRPVLLEKIPSGRAGEDYITVYVGIKRTLRVKYVISRDLLSHHLFQVLLKCSEDEFGQDYAQKGGFAIICDPALFLQVVKMVDDSMNDPKRRPATLPEDEHSSCSSDEC